MDKTVFWVTVIGFAFIVGIEVGEDNAATHLANTCTQQPGESLVSTIQDKRGVTCIYNKSYARQAIKRSAT